MLFQFDCDHEMCSSSLFVINIHGGGVMIMELMLVHSVAVGF